MAMTVEQIKEQLYEVASSIEFAAEDVESAQDEDDFAMVSLSIDSAIYNLRRAQDAVREHYN